MLLLYLYAVCTCLINQFASFCLLVVKFKRRPQYLEYFVHLAHAALSQGKGEMLVDWAQEVFLWIKKYNYYCFANVLHNKIIILLFVVCSGETRLSCLQKLHKLKRPTQRTTHRNHTHSRLSVTALTTPSSRLVQQGQVKVRLQ